MSPSFSSPITHPSCEILVGTSGFSYPEWKDAAIYPKGAKSAEMLSLYCLRFAVVELNYTWYQMAHADSLARMQSRVSASFQFAVKLTRTMTHEIAEDWPQQAQEFQQGLQPLLKSNQLAAILIQLPPTFERTRKNRLYLSQLLDALDTLPLAVEFRHHSWARDEVFIGLEQRKITLVAIDSPPIPTLFPSLDVITNTNLFYIRFHGRNTAGWHSGTMQHKFDYNYQEQELKQWTNTRIPAMAEKCQKGLLFFNNHVAGQSVRNAEATIQLLNIKE